MTTATNSTLISHASTTTFRVWGAQLSAMLDTIGFTKTGDTGQINWATATKPGVNASGGYEIRYFNDSLHGTAPIVVKLEYGTGTSSAYPGMWITIGTGSSGAGAITGVLLAREAFQGDSLALDSTVAVKTSRACMSDGCVWFTFKEKNRSGLYPAFCMYIERTKDDAGVSTGDGFVFYRGPLGFANYCSGAFFFMFAGGYSASVDTGQAFGGGVVSGNNSGYAFLPYNLGYVSTIVAGVPGDYQVARHYHPNPQVRPLLGVVSISPTDAISAGTVIPITVLGVTSHNYVCVEQTFSYYEFFGLIWE